jgi:hypothetical protein
LTRASIFSAVLENVDGRVKPGHDASNDEAADLSVRFRELLAPGREGVVEGAFAGGAFFDGDDGAALVGVN